MDKDHPSRRDLFRLAGRLVIGAAGASITATLLPGCGSSSSSVPAGCVEVGWQASRYGTYHDLYCEQYLYSYGSSCFYTSDYLNADYRHPKHYECVTFDRSV